MVNCCSFNKLEKNISLLILSFYSLLAEVSHDKGIMIGKRNTSAGLRCVFYHEYLSSQPITCDITYRTRFCAITTVRQKKFQPAISTGHAHSTLNEIDFENQEVSTTNVVGGYVKESVGTGRGLSISSPSNLLP